MSNPPINRILAFVNLLVLTILVLDIYVLVPSRSTEIFDRYSSTKTMDSQAGTISHWTNFIHTTSGNRYREPYTAETSLQPKDTFHVDKSMIFGRPIHLVYKTSTGVYVLNAGALNEGYTGMILGSYIILISLLNVFTKQVIRRETLNQRLLFSGTSILCVALLFYFI